MEQHQQQEIIIDYFSILPVELLMKIAYHIDSYTDYLSFLAVCRKLGFDNNNLPIVPPNHIPPQFPILLLPQQQPKSELPIYSDCTLLITDPFRTCFHNKNNIPHNLHIPECTFPRLIISSSNGYLIITSFYSPQIFCFNPITRARIELPPFTSFPGVLSFNSFWGLQVRDRFVYNLSRRINVNRYDMHAKFIKKLVLSDEIALAIIMRYFNGDTVTELVYCKITTTTAQNNNVWVPVPVPVPGTWDRQIEDVIYNKFDGWFYAVNNAGDVGIIKITFQQHNNNNVIDELTAATIDVIVKTNSDTYCLPVRGRRGRTYLVWLENKQKLLLVIREYRQIWPPPRRTSTFHVFEAVFDTDRSLSLKWRRRKWPEWSLDDTVIFVGRNETFSVSAPEFRGGVGNRIYFTDEKITGFSRNYDVGFFARGIVHPLPYFRNHTNDEIVFFESPLWFFPNFA